MGRNALHGRGVDAHLDGAINDIRRFAQSNSSYPDIVEPIGWWRNKDNTYSVKYVVVLGNGAEDTLISNYKLTETEYFKEILKHGY